MPGASRGKRGLSGSGTGVRVDHSQMVHEAKVAPLARQTRRRLPRHVSSYWYEPRPFPRRVMLLLGLGIRTDDRRCASEWC